MPHSTSIEKEAMKAFELEIRPIEVEEYQSLRASTGWEEIEDAHAEQALQRDLFSVCVMNENQIIGIGRVIGDGAIYFYIQDVIVLPEFQKFGIGKLIMNQIEDYLNEQAPNNAFIGLMAAVGVQRFYEKFGYAKRPDGRPGMYKMMKKA